MFQCFATETHFQAILMRGLGERPRSVYLTVVYAIKITITENIAAP